MKKPEVSGLKENPLQNCPKIYKPSIILRLYKSFFSRNSQHFNGILLAGLNHSQPVSYRGNEMEQDSINPLLLKSKRGAR